MPTSEERNTRVFRSPFPSFEEALRYALNQHDAEFSTMDAYQVVIEKVTDEDGKPAFGVALTGGSKKESDDGSSEVIDNAEAG